MTFTEDILRVQQSIKYKGCNIIPYNGKYWVFNQPLESLRQAKKMVDDAQKALKKSIK